MRLRLIGRAALCGAIGLLGLVASPASAADQTFELPGTSNSRQVVLVTAKSMKSTTATLATYERTAQGWRQIGRSTTAFLGRHGLVPGLLRKQSTGTTPMGTYALNSSFGRLPDPGAKLPYTQIDRNDAWTYNPKVPSTYNLLPGC